MTVFVSDTFTDSDDTLLENHTPDTGGAWTKRSGAEDLSITSNKIEHLVGTEIEFYTNAATPGGVDYNVQGDYVFNGGASTRMGLLGRYADADNMYRAYYLVTNTTWYLYKKLSGSFTLLDSLQEAWPGGTVTMKLEILTATKKVYAGVAEKLTSNDDDVKGAGSVGIYTKSGSFTLDDFIADDVGEAAAENASMQPIHHWWPR